MKTKTPHFFTVLLFCFLVIPNSGRLFGQAVQSKEYYPMDYSRWMVFVPGDASTTPFYISAKPVTNKEYILFLVWTDRVFYGDYPEVLYDVLPGFNTGLRENEEFRPFADSASFRFYLDHTDKYVSDYIFNPAYLDYPVIGVSWEQANKFCHWLSDRYNEYSLVKKKYLLLDVNQVDEYNFSTESFIFRQFEGLWNKDPETFWNSNSLNGFDYVQHILRPSFHLATRNELKLCSKIDLPTVTKKLYGDFNNYSKKGSEFLEPFYTNFLPEYKGYIYVSPPDLGVSTYITSDYAPGKMETPKKISEWCLDSYLPDEGKSVETIYKGYGFGTEKFIDPLKEEIMESYPQKDSLGRMPLLITGETPNKEFEVLKGNDKYLENVTKSQAYIFDDANGTVVNKDGGIFTCFRFAVNAIKK